jgi:hypothetical protein
MPGQAVAAPGEAEARLRTLLLRGALRLVEKQLPGKRETTEADPVEFQK